MIGGRVIEPPKRQGLYLVYKCGRKNMPTKGDEILPPAHPWRRTITPINLGGSTFQEFVRNDPSWCAPKYREKDNYVSMQPVLRRQPMGSQSPQI